MTTSTQQLVNKVIAAHGGANAANYKTLKIHTNIGGVVWPIKGHDGALADVAFTGSLTEQKSSWKNLFQPGYTSTFEPGKVQLLDENGKVLEELINPRESFKGHTVETPWTRAQLVYFSSYATWNYATAPFNFLVLGVEINELEPWNEKGETLSRLEVIYPDGFATHSKRQVFYFDENSLLKRHDYWPVVLGGSSATQIIEDYKEFQGVKTGTKRNIYILNDADNSYQTDPVLVSIDILDVSFE
ncbi:hypothetical protein AM493_08810 [Flavobacterium akiainvivens]|uniref:Uncharacterized protein n=1 Tax=Flavobacterium akiainvivens TaxID=1202724 RepID=A0A0N0RQN7_9FLAO|nr:hypothetical protein [Flavobacterium akiainvivens]KOS06122.1 hypothetical protein AM493_08810 [Flavobacterium akiainvivens]SFQ55158.1 hypothetical protein SAMN05444144_107246 [Flavobacterium akiainvivens]